MTPTTNHNIDRLVTALRDAIDEHGADNSFTCAEIAGNYNAPRATEIGRLLVRHCDEIRRRLGRVVERQIIEQEDDRLVLVHVGKTL